MPLELAETVSAKDKNNKPANIISIDTDSEKSVKQQFKEQSEVIENALRGSINDHDFNEEDAEGAITPKCVFENCRINLTPEDIRERTNKFMQTLNIKDEKTAAFASVKDAHKAEMKDVERELQKLRFAISNSWEWRDVECREEFNYQKGLVEIFRTDTGEKVRTRMMTDEERQQRLY